MFISILHFVFKYKLMIFSFSSLFQSISMNNQIIVKVTVRERGAFVRKYVAFNNKCSFDVGI